MSKSIEPMIRKITEGFLPKLAPEQTSKLVGVFKRAKQRGFKTKVGGNGINRTDDVTFIKSEHNEIVPVIIEYKGSKGYTAKFDNRVSHHVELLSDDRSYAIGTNSPISKYAVNGAGYYASVILQNTKAYHHILAVGINGWPTSNGIHYEGICYVLNREHPKELKPFDEQYRILNKVQLAKLLVDSPQDTADRVCIPRSKRLRAYRKATHKDKLNLQKYLQQLNQYMYDLKLGFTPSNRIALIVGCLLASMSENRKILLRISNSLFMTSLKKSIDTILSQKFPKNGAGSKATSNNNKQTKKQVLIQFLQPIFTDSRYSKNLNDSNESVAQHVYSNVSQKIYPLYAGSEENGETYFANILYNVMTSWLNSEQLASESKDDVVLTPSYVADLMTKIAQVKYNSHVWDWALGSGGLLISAMNYMIKQARHIDRGNSKQLYSDISLIRNHRLLGVEKLADIYVLALVNMILAQDGKSEILNESSIGNRSTDFNKDNLANSFHADRLLLNPPYDQSNTGHGMIFAQEAMSHMTKGYASVIIMRSAGNGQATEQNRAILKDNALIASIKMPNDLFKGAQTEIYLFKIGDSQHPAKQRQVLFVDFTNDGLLRNHRKNTHTNIRSRTVSDGRTLAEYRYNDLEQLVNYFISYGCHDPKDEIKQGYFADDRHYCVDTIASSASDDRCGNDWNYDDHLHNDLSVTTEDINKAIKAYLRYKINSWLQ